MRLAVIFVHYHTPELLARSVAAIECELAALAVPSECLVVDNGSTPAGRSRLQKLPVRLIEPGANLGYAGGINLGVEQTTADVLIFLNPDVLVQTGCLRALLTVLDQGAAVAGPRFFWDETKRFFLPPTELRTKWAEFSKRLAPLDMRLARWTRQAWRAHAQSHWLATSPFSSFALSGALLAVRRDAWEQVGPFDTGYQLYFEETDWLARLEHKGGRACYVPDAMAVHFYNQSAAREPLAHQWFAASEKRFLSRRYGQFFFKTLGWLNSLPNRLHPDQARFGQPQLDLTQIAAPDDYPVWIEFSPDARGIPAAAELISTPPNEIWSFPPVSWQNLSPGRYVVTVVNREGIELFRCVCERKTGALRV